MRTFLALALLVLVAGCGSAPPAPTAKEQAAPKVSSGKQASGISMDAPGH